MVHETTVTVQNYTKAVIQRPATVINGHVLPALQCRSAGVQERLLSPESFMFSLKFFETLTANVNRKNSEQTPQPALSFCCSQLVLGVSAMGSLVGIAVTIF